MQVVIHSKAGKTRAMAGYAPASLKAFGFNYEEGDETVEDFCTSYTACNPGESLLVCELALLPVTKQVCEEFSRDLDEQAAFHTKEIEAAYEMQANVDVSDIEDRYDLCKASADMLRQFIGNH